MTDPYDLERFIAAQQPLYARVCAELAAGAKTSHWMWFVFPQLGALGRSATARHYGISGLAEAQAYWRHPLLGPRLAECTDLMLRIHGKTAREVLGPPDDLKFRSSMTLFERAAPDAPVFGRALEQYFDGVRDPLTLQALA